MDLLNDEYPLYQINPEIENISESERDYRRAEKEYAEEYVYNVEQLNYKKSKKNNRPSKQ